MYKPLAGGGRCRRVTADDLDLDRLRLLARAPVLFQAEVPGTNIRALREAAGNQSQVTDWRRVNAEFAAVLEQQRNMMRIILLAIIAIAGLNMGSGLVMLVKNKGRDIAILRTMGAGRGAVMRSS